MVQIKAVGDCGALVELGDSISEAVNGRVMELNRNINELSLEGVLETVPAFCSVLIFYDPLKTDYEAVSKVLFQLSETLEAKAGTGGRLVEIPVCYGGSFGPDLSFVAEHGNITEEEVIRIHSGRDYRIFMLGFLPGFPYLGGMDERIFTPRLKTPRTRIPAGSVGIGGEQTGIYPMDSPGGWQLIGRTPYRLFKPEEAGKSLYEAGDSIRFVPISQEEFEEISRKQEKG
ncbi:5-oxoprolinase subunit PxpB [Lacrimispora sp.]|uniref:5-oxoprolinase subunit PxpB n=1 Tax=Lacrimispora sp. TaxID=2719234 RepID=UPI00345F1F4A